jgi:hypothetical protein
MPRPKIVVDKDKLRAAIRKLGHEYVFYTLDDAIDLLPPTKLNKLGAKYIDLKRLRPDNGKKNVSLLVDMKAFDKASRVGEYYESFMVNSNNCMEQSTGTTAWISEHGRLLDRCVGEQKKGNPGEIRQAFDVLCGLLDYIDECNDDVIFFADEGGSWQVGVDWDRVLPPSFRALSATAAPEEYAERIDSLLKHHYNYGRDKMLAVAHKTATPEQRAALADAAGRQVRGRRPGAKT